MRQSRCRALRTYPSQRDGEAYPAHFILVRIEPSLKSGVFSVDTNRCIDLKERPLEFIGASLDDLRAFPEVVRGVAGAELRRLQRGEMPRQSRTFATVGPGTFEIKINDREGAFRVFYVARFDEAVYVLHAFRKKSQKTSRPDVEIGRQRYRHMLELRRK